MKFGGDSGQRVNELLRRRNGLLRTMVFMFGVATLLTGFIVWDLHRDAKRKDAARENAVSDLLQAIHAVDSVGGSRYDSLAAVIKRLHPEAIPAPSRLDTIVLRGRLMEQKVSEKK